MDRGIEGFARAQAVMIEMKDGHKAVVKRRRSRPDAANKAEEGANPLDLSAISSIA